MIGVEFWDVAVCGNDASAIARAIGHAVQLAGVDHVALGADFDGAINAPFDVTGLPLVTQALEERAFSDAEIEKIMGGNVMRLLQQMLP